MTRSMYGFRPSDYTTDAQGTPRGGVALTVWNQVSGGTQITDLLTVTGTAITLVTSAADGRVAFQGPDGYLGPLWVAAGSTRYLVEPVDMAARIAELEAASGVDATPVLDFVWNPTDAAYQYLSDPTLTAAALVRTGVRKRFTGPAAHSPLAIASPAAVLTYGDQFARVEIP